jgi:hypothetical protein
MEKLLAHAAGAASRIGHGSMMVEGEGCTWARLHQQAQYLNSILPGNATHIWQQRHAS